MPSQNYANVIHTDHNYESLMYLSIICLKSQNDKSTIKISILAPARNITGSFLWYFQLRCHLIMMLNVIYSENDLENLMYVRRVFHYIMVSSQWRSNVTGSFFMIFYRRCQHNMMMKVPGTEHDYKSLMYLCYVLNQNVASPQWT